MPYPNRDEIKAAILQLLKRSTGELTTSQVSENLVKAFGISEREVRAKTSESGESAWKLRLRQAKQALIKSGELHDGGAGRWRLPKAKGSPRS